MLDLPTERFQEHFNLNVFGTLRLCKAVIPHMVRRNPSQRQGLVINIGSMVGVVCAFHTVLKLEQQLIKFIDHCCGTARTLCRRPRCT